MTGHHVTLTDAGYYIAVYVKLDYAAAVIDLSQTDENEYYMNRIIVPTAFRNKGIGTAMLGKLCDRADREQYTITVDPTTNYGSDLDRLTAFFVRFGFKPTLKPGGPRLHRLPKRQ